MLFLLMYTSFVNYNSAAVAIARRASAGTSKTPNDDTWLKYGPGAQLYFDIKFRGDPQ